MSIPYSAEKNDLYHPAKHAVFFSAGRPKSDAALCAELSRLAYCRLETSFGFDKDRIRKLLARVGFTDCQFFGNSVDSDCEGTHCFLGLEEDNHRTPKLAFVAFRGTDKDDPTDLAHDFNAWPESWKQQRSQVHSGFAEALAQVESDVLAALKGVSCRVLSPDTVWERRRRHCWRPDPGKGIYREIRLENRRCALASTPRPRAGQLCLDRDSGFSLARATPREQLAAGRGN